MGAMMTPVTVLVLLFCLTVQVKTEVFSSTARLESLFESSDKISDYLEDYIEEEEERLSNIRSLMNEVKSMANKTAGDRVKFVEHPLGAFHLIKKYSKIDEEIQRGEDTKNKLYEEVDAASLKIPTQEDYIGSASAILRLQRIYNLPRDALMKGYVRDRFIEPLAMDDALTLAAKAKELHFVNQAIEWYDVPLRASDVNPDEHVEIVIAATLGIIEIYLQSNDFDNAYAFSNWANQSFPDDPRVIQVHADVLYKNEQLKLGKLAAPPAVTPAVIDEQYAALCRGEVDWNNEYISGAFCRVTTDSVPYRLVKQEILSLDPFISIFYDVLSESEGKYFRATAKNSLNRAMVGDPSDSVVSEVRVGQLTWLDDSEPAIKKISERVMDITGLDATMREVHSSSESFQIVNYGIGGHYEPHIDVYDNKSVLNDVPDFLKNTGDRLATFLFYLDDVVEGGSTVFPRVGVQVPVVKNGAAFWYNLFRTGDNDIRLTHAGCPVLLGQKWVANKWIRERGNEFTHKCGLTPTTPHFKS